MAESPQLSQIHPGASIGEGVKVGAFTIIDNDVVIGDGVVIDHHVVIKPGARIGRGSYIGPYCYLTGPLYIGERVQLRAFDVISRGVEIHDGCFFGSGVTTTSLASITYGRGDQVNYRTRFRQGCIIGSRAVLIAGLDLPAGTIIGQGANVVRPIHAAAVYAGNPAVRVRDLGVQELFAGRPGDMPVWDAEANGYVVRPGFWRED